MYQNYNKMFIAKCSVRILLFLLISIPVLAYDTFKSISVGIIEDQTTERDTLFATEYFEKARHALRDIQYNASISYYKKAAEIYEKHKIWDKYIQSLNGIGNNYMGLVNMDSVYMYFEKAFSISDKYLVENHPVQADTYSCLGRYYSRMGYYKKALEYHFKALEIRTHIFTDKDDLNRTDIADSYFYIGHAYDMGSQYDQALQYYKKALNICLAGLDSGVSKEDLPDITIIYDCIGQCYTYKGLYDEALSYLDKALNIRLENLTTETDHLFDEDIATSYKHIGDVYLDKGQYDRALSYYEKAVSIGLENLNSDVDNRIQIEMNLPYNNIGICYYSMGDYDQALDYYKKTLSVQIRILGEEHPNVALLYDNMGSCYGLKGVYDLGLDYYVKALKIYTKILDEDHPAIASVYANMGLTYEAKKDYDQALECIHKALEIGIKSLGEDHPSVAKYYNNLGLCYEAKKDYDSAVKHYTNALNIYGEAHPNTSVAYYNIGVCYLNKRKYGQALAQFQKSLTLYCVDFDNQNITSNPVLKNISSKPFLLRALEAKAYTLSERYKQTNDTNDLELSFSTYQLAVSLIDTMRFEMISPDVKQMLVANSILIYQDAVEQAFHLYGKTQNSDFLHRAFSILEKSRAFLLLQNITDSRAKHFADIPDSLLIMENDLKAEIANHEMAVFDLLNYPPDADVDEVSTDINNYQDKLFDSKRAFESLIALMEEKYPQYYQLKYDLTTASLQDIQKQLNENTAFLTFSVKDTSASVFIITANEIHFDVYYLDSSFQNGIEGMRQGLTDLKLLAKKPEEAFNLYKSNAFSLYDKLLRKRLDQIRSEGDQLINKLVIVPDGFLNHLPFELLLTEPFEDKAGNYSDLPYLLKQYDISYYQSATLFKQHFVERRKKRNTRLDYLGFAPSYSGTVSEINSSENRVGLSQLRYSKSEVKDAQNLFSGKTFLDEQASEANFKIYAPEASIIHLAMHAEFDDLNPAYSKLFFSQTKDTPEDDILHTAEIYNIPINADLAILSACSSGFGKIEKGEGTMSLSRAFAYAGCPSTVMTLWSVNDHSTADVITRFYKQLGNGMAKDEALRKAKLEFLEQAHPNMTHPYYWGGLTLIGDTKPIELGTKFNWLYVLFSVLSLGVIIFLGLRIVNKKAAS